MLETSQQEAVRKINYIIRELEAEGENFFAEDISTSADL